MKRVVWGVLGTARIGAPQRYAAVPVDVEADGPEPIGSAQEQTKQFLNDQELVAARARRGLDPFPTIDEHGPDDIDDALVSECVRRANLEQVVAALPEGAEEQTGATS